MSVSLLTLTLAWLPLPQQQPRTSVRRALSPQLQVNDYDSTTYNPEVSGLNIQAAEDSGRAEGLHGTGYRFMPTSTISKEHSPAVVLIAGIYPGVTGEQLAQPKPVPFAPSGRWNYHMLTPDAAPGGFVAVPGTAQLSSHPDTVAVVCMSSSLGLEFADAQEHEVLALIDRSDIATIDRAQFDSKTFYALVDPQGVVHIRWMNALPEDWRVAGRLLYSQMPFVTRPGAGGGFAEMSDEFEF